mmetsp:Transcript_26221/g.32330  ORF Transcript_26221/g.32330 Transcript_26221/m.32330 type:complete len:490 (+) Transcript_26221:121-1590(+)
MLIHKFFFVCLICNEFKHIHSFLLAGRPTISNKVKLISTQVYAKVPPTSKFNLNEIEEFEAELDWQLKQETQAIDGLEEGDDNDDNEIFFGSENEEVKNYEVTPELHNKRIDAILSEMVSDLSRSQCRSLVTSGMVAITLPSEKSTRDRKPTVTTRKSLKLEKGTLLHVKNVIEERPTEIISQNLPLDIMYEDEHMIVLNKAAGMVVHPAVGNWDGTVVNALAYYLANESPFGSGEFIAADGNVKSEKGEGVDIDGTDGEAIIFRPGIVHRLDKGTTGILVVAKTRQALTLLSGAFAAREVKKAYVAITVGNPGKRVVIDKPIGRHPTNRQRMRVVPDPNRMNSSGMSPNQKMALGVFNGKSVAQVGRKALSFVDTLAFDGKLGVAHVRIETGRTHQIRVHLQDRTTPIFGDDVYGFSDWNKRLFKSHGIQRPLLHAFRLELNHPITGKKMIFRAPMADDMSTVAIAIWPNGKDERSDLFEKSEIEIIE